MARLSALTFLLAVALASADQVIELGDSNFEAELENHEVALVMFYAPWCGHCKRLKPEFEKAAKDLKANDPPVALVKVDCTEAGKDTCGRFEVRGYPTLKIFRSGELSQDYNGPREAAGITKYMKAQVGPSSKELKTANDLEAFLDKAEVTIVSFLEAESDRETFAKVADKQREEATFGHFSGDKADAKRKGKVILHRPKHLQTKMEDAEVIFDGAVTKEALTKWIKRNYHGIVGHRTVDNVGDFKPPLVVALYDVDYVKNVKGTNYWRNRVMKVAKKHDKFNYAVSNKDDFMQEATEYGLSAIADEKPRIIVRGDGDKKYVMEEEFSMDSFEAFLVKLEAGEIEPYIKSEDVPEDNSAPVKVAVAKNFEELVQKSEKDVLVEFYAPWCGHCKKLAPVFDELGEKMANENVEIVKMDATANDVPSGFDVRGFPTLYWLPQDTKEPKAYQGGRELDEFIKYIAENASSELKGYDRKGKAKKTEL